MCATITIFVHLIRNIQYRYAPARPLKRGTGPTLIWRPIGPCAWKVDSPHALNVRLAQTLRAYNQLNYLVNLWRTSKLDMHTNPCANMKTHWPVHLKRDPRPTHFWTWGWPIRSERASPIRSEHASAEICSARSERANVHYRQTLRAWIYDWIMSTISLFRVFSYFCSFLYSSISYLSKNKEGSSPTFHIVSVSLRLCSDSNCIFILIFETSA